MKSLILSTVAATFTAFSAHAGHPAPTPTGGGSNATAIAAPVSVSQASSSARSSSRSTSASFAVSGPSTSRAAGGKASSIATGGNAAGGSANVGTAVNVSAGTGAVYGSARAPDVYVPGAAGMDCPTVGFGASGAGLTGGGGFGPSWISTDCNARKLAELLASLGHRDAAVEVLHRQFPDLFPRPPGATPVAATAVSDPAWCRQMDLRSKALDVNEEKRYMEECHK